MALHQTIYIYIYMFTPLICVMAVSGAGCIGALWRYMVLCSGNGMVSSKNENNVSLL